MVGVGDILAAVLAEQLAAEARVDRGGSRGRGARGGGHGRAGARGRLGWAVHGSGVRDLRARGSCSMRVRPLIRGIRAEYSMQDSVVGSHREPG